MPDIMYIFSLIEANTLLSGVGFENTSCAAAHGIHAGLTQIPSTHKYLPDISKIRAVH